MNVDVTDTSVRYVRLSITGNTGWPAGQLSELEVHGTSTPTPTPTTRRRPLRPPARTSPSAGPSSRRRPSGPTPRPTPSTGTSAPTGRAPAASTRATSPSRSRRPASCPRSWSSSTRTARGAPAPRPSRCRAATGTGAFTTLASSARLHLQPVHRQHRDHPGQRHRGRRPARRSPRNTGAPAGQVAEFQVIGAPAPNPDLTVTGGHRARPTPMETDAVTLTATVKNAGTAASAATPSTSTWAARRSAPPTVGALAAGATDDGHREHRRPRRRHATARAPRSTRPTPSSSRTRPTTPTRNPTRSSSARCASSDLVAASVSWSPSNPAAGDGRHLPGGRREPGHHRHGDRRARHHADRRLNERAPWSGR